MNKNLLQMQLRLSFQYNGINNLFNNILCLCTQWYLQLLTKSSLVQGNWVIKRWNEKKWKYPKDNKYIREYLEKHAPVTPVLSHFFLLFFFIFFNILKSLFFSFLHWFYYSFHWDYRWLSILQRHSFILWENGISIIVLSFRTSK